MRIFKVLNSIMKRNSAAIALSLLMGVLTVLSGIGMVSTSSILISKAALHPDVLELMVFIVGVRFFSISRGIFRYLDRLISHNATFKILSHIRRWFYKSFNDNYSENNKEFKTGDIYTRLVNDVDSLKEFFLRAVYPIITAVIIGILTFILLILFSVHLAVVFLLFYIFTGFILPIIMFRINSKLMKKEQNIKKTINLTLIDMLNGILEIYVYGLKDTYEKKYIELSSSLSALQKKKNFIQLLGESMHSLCVSCLIVFAMIILSKSVYEGRLAGIYYAMVPLAIMASFEALLPMPNVLYKFSEANNAGSSIYSIIQDNNETDMSEEGVPADCELSIAHLSVKESDSEKYIIKDVSLELPEGKKVAVVGMSGAGKSTLLKALLGFMKYSEGSIRLGGKSFSVLDAEEIRKNFTYVEQNPYLFSTTINENLLIADSNASGEDIWTALKKSYLDEYIKSLQNGLETSLGQFGQQLSGGEKQRLAIARALLKESPIILLDEPTASLDVELEAKVVDALHKALQNKSCIWVTHRLIGMAYMDEILLMHKGAVLERGTHAQLLERRGLYYKLWSMQQRLIKVN